MSMHHATHSMQHLPYKVEPWIHGPRTHTIWPTRWSLRYQIRYQISSDLCDGLVTHYMCININIKFFYITILLYCQTPRKSNLCRKANSCSAVCNFTLKPCIEPTNWWFNIGAHLALLISVVFITLSKRAFTVFVSFYQAFWGYIERRGFW